VWAQYSLMMDNRDAFIVAMQQKKIPTAIYYPIPLHLQVVFQSLGYQKGDFPVAESVANRIVSLPIHPYLKDSEVDHIIASAVNFFSSLQS
jgi:UDP-2-acetamido-2-deoxy-ribo-hexuluronate aminotransferase